MRLPIPVPIPGRRYIERWAGAIARYWLQRHVPPDPPRIRLHRRRLFILPTPLGYLFGITVAILLLGSLNYGTSLGFVVTFLLAGSGALAMVHTYRNLEALELVFAAPTPVFAGQELRLPVRLRTPDRTRWAIDFDGSDQNPERGPVDADAVTQRSYRFATQRRGRFRPPRLRIATIWPFGLFRVWSWVWPEVETVVYPACIDHGLAPPPSPSERGSERRHARGDEEFAGLRPYRPGDSPRRIAWRVFARSDELMVKAFEADPSGDHWLDWSALTALAPEQRLEQLCDWVVRHERAGLRYGLALPDRRIGPASGAEHRRRCLEALALFGQDAEVAA